MNAGLDLEMPGSTKWRGDILVQAVGVGKVHQHVLDQRARNVLKLVNRCAAAKIPEYAEEKTADTKETAALLRKIGADSIVLMKNEGKILPLKKDKKTLILGPNAKIATYHGGGSASLAAYYAVTPFEGISSQLTTAPSYTVGCYAHKELPLLGTMLKTEAGAPGVRFRAYNEPPSTKDRELADDITLTKTEFLMMDYQCPRLKSPLWYADIEGSFTAEEDCKFEIGLGVYGTAKLFVNGELLIDNDTTQTKGEMFFNCGTIEERGILVVKKGEKYDVKVEYGSAPTCKLNQGSNVAFGGGAMRIGGAKVIVADEEVKHAAALAKEADQVIICAGLNVRLKSSFASSFISFQLEPPNFRLLTPKQADWETEGSDRADMDLPGHMNALISAVSAANPSTVVIMQSGTPVAMPWLSSVNALVHAWYGGNETGNAIADILFGNVNPSAKLPLSFPKRLQDNPAFLNYRTERGRTLYGEDIYMGYRWYEMLDMDVAFPFGHGLSYTSFELSDLKVAKKDEKLNVSVKVTNTGDREGAEVVQVYVSQKKPSIRRPKKELKGFTKVVVKEGESQVVEVPIDVKYAASFWDEVRNAWIIEKDSYEVIVGDSSSGLRALKESFEVEETSWWNGL